MFEELARAKGAPRVAFVKVDLAARMGTIVAGEHGVTATPTFGFLWDEKKVRVWFGLDLLYF